jgi:uncharacterized protein involved in tolerance to divalent cations
MVNYGYHMRMEKIGITEMNTWRKKEEDGFVTAIHSILFHTNHNVESVLIKICGHHTYNEPLVIRLNIESNKYSHNKKHVQMKWMY